MAPSRSCGVYCGNPNAGSIPAASTFRLNQDISGLGTRIEPIAGRPDPGQGLRDTLEVALDHGVTAGGPLPKPALLWPRPGPTP